MGGPRLHLEQVAPVQRKSAGLGQHRLGGVPGQVPGLGDLASAVVLDERERHLQGPRRQLLGAARLGDQSAPLLIVAGRVQTGGVRTRAEGIPRQGQTDRDRGRGPRHGVGVAEHRDADHLDADGVQRAAAGALTAVDGGDELAHLGLVGLGRRQVQSVGAVAVDGQDADLGGQVRQVGRV